MHQFNIDSKLELDSIKPPGARVYQIRASNYFKATEIYALNTMDDIWLRLHQYNMNSHNCVTTVFVQGGCQTVKPTTPIFNRVRARPPLHLLWKFGSDLSSHFKDSVVTNIKKQRQLKTMPSGTVFRAVMKQVVTANSIQWNILSAIWG